METANDSIAIETDVITRQAYLFFLISPEKNWEEKGENVRMVTTFCIYQEFCFKNDVIVNEIINKKNQNYVIVSFRFLDEPWTN